MLTPEFQQRYQKIVSEYFNSSDEQYLLMAADLGRELVQAGLHPEDIAEIHENALSALAAEKPQPRKLGPSIGR